MRWQQITGAMVVLVFRVSFLLAVCETLAHPLFEMFSGFRRKLGEEESRAPMVAGPDHIGAAVDCDVGPRQYASKRHIGIHRHGLGGLQGEAVLANIDANG